MLASKICIEKTENLIVAWCNPIDDESFLMANIQLDVNEVESLKTYTSDRRRREWLTTRWLLQQVITPEIRIRYHENGSPHLSDLSKSISISHCQELIAVIVGRNAQKVGIDCETLLPRILKIKHKFAKNELDQIVKNELENLTLIWCAKEALFKQYSQGSIDFNVHLRVNDFDFSTEGGTFTGTILKENVTEFTLQYKYIQNSVLVWVSE